MRLSICTFICIASACSVTSFNLARTAPQRPQTTQFRTLLRAIVSPFDDSDDEAGEVATATYTPLPTEGDEPLDLTWENVDMVLDEMRPYLLQGAHELASTRGTRSLSQSRVFNR